MVRRLVSTTFTHGFVGASLALLAPKEVPRVAIGITAATLAVIPDLDVLAFSYGIPYEHPLGHRGLTHSLTFAVCVATIVSIAFHRYAPVGSRSWLKLTLVLFLAIASNGFLDAFTDGGRGVGFFIPFDNSRYFFATRPLATTPIGFLDFFSGRGISILTNEFILVWIPVLATMTFFRISRRSERRGSKTVSSILVVAGIYITAMSVSADLISIGEGGFGPQQIMGTAGGAVITLTGLFLMYKLRSA